ncbi:MAG: endolytic transglycosylase MltG [Bacillota bacterium]|nr:endolytic transglycosylase MltG [Bacillota bacterium]
MKKVIIILVVILVLALIAVPAYRYFIPMDVDDVTVDIPAESTSAEIGKILTENQVIRGKLDFKLYLKFSGRGSALKNGSYTFDGAYTIDQVVDRLEKGGDTVGTKVTIPEGYNMEQIISVLEEKGITTREEFLDAAANGDYNYDYIGAKGDSLRVQGYLFPETYLFNKGISARDVINTMINQFDSVYNDEWRAYLAERGISVKDWVTMASIVEKEAVVQEDRPIIAGVFYNRLGQGMLLQSCATVQYALGKVKPVLTNEDVAIESPYNTYINQGLPPTPIASPGKASLEAALYPTDTDYLFFVAKPNGAHIFTKTYEEHLAAIEAIRRGDYDNE